MKSSRLIINRAVGQRNRSAVHYHFGDRAGLVAAIRAKHRPGVDRRRQVILQQLLAAGHPTIRDLVRALIEPAVPCLDDPSGRDFLIIVTEGAAKAGGESIVSGGLAHTAALRQLVDLLAPLLAGTAEQRSLYIRMAITSYLPLISQIARDVNRDTLDEHAVRTRVQALIDYTTCALGGE